MKNTMIFDPPHIPEQSTLRDYQKECIEKIEEVKEGNYLIVLPTGAGKTYVFSHIPRHGRVLILSHRDELVRQPQKYYDCSYGVEKAKEKSNGEEVVSASVQSLVRRLNRFDPYDFDLIITDEAHHSIASSYKKIYNYFKPRLHLGFTATPNRGDRQDLNKIYDKILYFKDIKWGIENEFLTDINCLRVDIGYDLRKVRQQMGDFNIGDLSSAMCVDSCIDLIAKAYEKYHVGQTLIFGVNVEHCIKMQKKIPGSKMISAATPNRAQLLKDFSDRKFECLINCMVLTEGTDLPLVETVIVARPTRNQSLYTQIVGRGLRPYPGKKFLTLIDCVGVSKMPICSAPSLFGLNIEDLTKKQRKKAVGLLTDMDKTVKNLFDSPSTWIRGVERINLFEKQANVNTMHLNCTIFPDDSIKIPFDRNCYIYIYPPDALNKTHAEEISISTSKKSKIKITETKDLQDVIKDVYVHLVNNRNNSRKLWDLKAIENGWGAQKASEKQIAYIIMLATQAKINMSEIDLNTLTKQQAMHLIEHLKSKKKVFYGMDFNKAEEMAKTIKTKQMVQKKLSGCNYQVGDEVKHYFNGWCKIIKIDKKEDDFVLHLKDKDNHLSSLSFLKNGNLLIDKR